MGIIVVRIVFEIGRKIWSSKVPMAIRIVKMVKMALMIMMTILVSILLAYDLPNHLLEFLNHEHQGDQPDYRCDHPDHLGDYPD